MFVKKRTLLFLSLCASALNAQLVQADMVNAPSSQVSSSQVAETGGQLSVVDEAGQIKAILSNIQGEIIGVTAQFSTETNSGITVTFSMDEQGRYVAVLDRSAFAEEDQVFSLKLTAQLTDGSFQTLSDYSFEWKKDVVSAAEKPTALDNSDATPSKIEEEATSTTTSSTVNSSLTAGATSSTSNSLTRSSSNTIAGSSNGSASVPSARVSTASSSVNVTQPTGTITIENRNDAQGTFDVRVTNVSSPKDIASVILPTWSQSDDLRWYEATRQSDGSYKLTVNKKDHKYRTGTYTVHLYYKDSNGGLTGAGGTTTHLSEAKPTGTITIENRNDAQGTFDVRVTNVSSPKDIASVLLPTWSQSDDIRWYEATRQSDGSYKLTVNKKDHKYRTGTYTVHLYYKDSNGGLTGAGGTTTHLSNPSAQRSYTVYIDPGHGGRDSGASYGGVHEKNLALSVSNKLRENLLQYGINVLMTRTGDYDVDFKTERSRMTNASNADLFISIHFNATGAGVSNATGIETYWYQYNPEYQPKINKEMHNNPTRLAESEILANKVQESLIKETGAVNRGVRRETFAVLRETAIPAILVELGFMDNPSELQVIKQDSYHTRLAKALAQGVMNWYGAVEGK
ncbi:GBS Bsp-like repeat-containing protein [Streptococcus suis]|uniref:GBS Bsp-like repeat-containing protein n=1 Tax=Streptococcus suis TaxID=1307 RepID=UPI001EE2CDD1|nr:GBS Bsp-like repeat-containing protein [Streptococcus suis]MCL4910463.1 GBS Bsp-like repeat-containing protein [Streptococcus suis]MCL4961256.1 GBS Bsp-like repeat-containing protein [Streptococcus suis]MCP8380158.1 GBS Bsp-like repeat-containing protein [Streptococcus suis]MCP8647584.1 GBS Bsp-like repeat-containing protein [Streptococcus suis]